MVFTPGTLVRLKSATQGWMKASVVEYVELLPAIGGYIYTGPGYIIKMLEGKHSGETIRVPANYVEQIPEEPEFFHRTYMDWYNLAEDIKQKMPPESWYIVNDLLLVISQEEGPVADEAKRWLMKKAGELGIR